MLTLSLTDPLYLRRPCKIKCTYNCHLGSIWEYHSNGLKLPRWGILQKISLAHQASRITHHTAHIAYEFEVVWKIKENYGDSLWQFILKSNPQKSYKIFFDDNHRIWTIQRHKTIPKLHFKSRFVCAVKTLDLKNWHQKKYKNLTKKSHNMCKIWRKKL